MAAEPEALRQPAIFERHGLGWIFRPPYAPVTLTFDRLVERRDEVTSEVHVTLRAGGHLARRRLNLLGSRSFTEFARELEDTRPDTNWPWRKMLVEGCESTLEAFRTGTPLVTIEGVLEKPEPIQWQCRDIVLANVPNCWVGAAGTGKSTFLKAYCLHHALGIPFLGHEMQRGVPLYLDYEDSEENFRRVIYEVGQGIGVERVPKLHWKRGGGPIRNQVHQLGELISRHGITMIGVDAIAAAGGEMGERGYESIAMDIEQAVVTLPPVTFILLDHVTGDETKQMAVPRKARGSVRKYEFVRYQWTLVADFEEAQRGRHIVGWTHTKTNITRVQPPFAVSITHQDDQVTFGQLAAVEVRPVAERMSVLDRCIAEITEAKHPLSLTQLAEAIYGTSERNKRESIRVVMQRDKGRHVIATTDGYWDLVERSNVFHMTDFKPDEDLPW